MLCEWQPFFSLTLPETPIIEIAFQYLFVRLFCVCHRLSEIDLQRHSVLLLLIYDIFLKCSLLLLFNVIK